MTMELARRQGEVKRLARWVWRIDVWLSGRWLSGSRGSSVEMEEERVAVVVMHRTRMFCVQLDYGCRGAGMSLVKDGVRIAVKSRRRQVVVVRMARRASKRRALDQDKLAACCKPRAKMR
jgi:hypothetical protein